MGVFNIIQETQESKVKTKNEGGILNMFHFVILLIAMQLRRECV